VSSPEETTGDAGPQVEHALTHLGLERRQRGHRTRLAVAAGQHQLGAELPALVDGRCEAGPATRGRLRRLRC
jgi:hypothetical protein